MPKREDLKTILIVGSGPIIIGQACEFDYSGTQACKALRDNGYRVVLVNSNPATIMTDPEIADATYIEPVDWQSLEKIIEKEIEVPKQIEKKVFVHVPFPTDDPEVIKKGPMIYNDKDIDKGKK